MLIVYIKLGNPVLSIFHDYTYVRNQYKYGIKYL